MLEINYFSKLSGWLIILSILLTLTLFLFCACQKSADDLALKTDTAVKSIKSNEDFEKAMTSSHQKLTVIEFYADWCGPCRDLAPVLEEVAHELNQSAQFYKLNIDQHRSLSMQKGVTGIPYVALFKAGKKIHSLMGLWPKESYRKIVKQFAFTSKINASMASKRNF
jgi:thioredoxin 1